MSPDSPEWHLEVIKHSLVLLDTLVLTSISILVQISDVADRHPEHGVIRPVEADRPSVIVPVTERVQVDVDGSTDLGLAVEKVGSSDN